jgi:hypothetical protein
VAGHTDAEDTRGNRANNEQSEPGLSMKVEVAVVAVAAAASHWTRAASSVPPGQSGATTTAAAEEAGTRTHTAPELEACLFRSKNR